MAQPILVYTLVSIQCFTLNVFTLNVLQTCLAVVSSETWKTFALVAFVCESVQAG